MTLTCTNPAEGRSGARVPAPVAILLATLVVAGALAPNPGLPAVPEAGPAAEAPVPAEPRGDNR